MSNIQSFPAKSQASSSGVNWPAEISSWQKSGLSQAAYCRQNQISYSAFLYWRKRIEKIESSSSKISFVRLDGSVFNDSSHFINRSPSPDSQTYSSYSSTGIRIFFNPLSVEVGPHFSPATLCQVIRILRSI